VLVELELPSATAALTVIVAASATAETASATAVTTATAAKSATATAAAKSATTSWALFARASFVYSDCAAIELFSVPEFNCCLCCFIGVHFDETKTARAAGHFVDDYLSRYYVASLREGLL
jgi:hypothetical protein